MWMPGAVTVVGHAVAGRAAKVAGTLAGSSAQRISASPVAGDGAFALTRTPTDVGLAPEAGVSPIVVTAATVSTRNSRRAGVGSVLTASDARTSKLCSPSVSGPNASPLVHGENTPRSIRQEKVAPAGGSAVNVQAGE